MHFNETPNSSTLEQRTIPRVSIVQKDVFESKTSPIYYCQAVNESGELIGKVDYQLLTKRKEIIIQSVELQRGKGYGKGVYIEIQSMYPEYTLVSSDQMTHSSEGNQENPDAVILWKSLVRDGLAEETEFGFKMKK